MTATLGSIISSLISWLISSVTSFSRTGVSSSMSSSRVGVSQLSRSWYTNSNWTPYRELRITFVPETESIKANNYIGYNWCYPWRFAVINYNLPKSQKEDHRVTDDRRTKLNMSIVKVGRKTNYKGRRSYNGLFFFLLIKKLWFRDSAWEISDTMEKMCPTLFRVSLKGKQLSFKEHTGSFTSIPRFDKDPLFTKIFFFPLESRQNTMAVYQGTLNWSCITGI